MTVSGRYFIPGPVEIDPEVAEAMLRPMIGHRGAEAHALVARIQPGLQALFGTTRPVMLATGSATAMIEAAVRSGVREQVLCIISGTFGARFADVAERCGKGVVRLHVHRGSVLEPEALEAMLDGPPIDAVTMVHSETSTGALAPVAELVRRFRQMDDVLTIVDAVSSVGGMPIKADEWAADFVLTGSQKAIGIPPGLAFGVASERFVERARRNEERGFYLDVIDLLSAAEQARFPQTPALPVVYALEAQLARIQREGLDVRFARHRAMRERVETWVTGHDRCGIMAPPGRRSDTVTALTLKPERSARQIVRTLADEGWQLSTGLEQDEDRVIRIGHMADLTLGHVEGVLKVLEELI